MNKILTCFLLAFIVFNGMFLFDSPVQAKRITKSRSVRIQRSKTVRVKGYMTKKGKFVKMHYRSRQER